MKISHFILFLFLIKIGYSQENNFVFENWLNNIKQTLAKEKINTIIVTRITYSTYSLDKMGFAANKDTSEDSIVYSKDGSYYKKIISEDGRTWITDYKNKILTINGRISNGVPNFLKNPNLFYSIFRADEYDSCKKIDSGRYNCKKDEKKIQLFFSESSDLIKIISDDIKEFSEFDEIYGLRYPTRIKGYIREEELEINSDVKITSLTVLKEGEN